MIYIYIYIYIYIVYTGYTYSIQKYIHIYCIIYVYINHVQSQQYTIQTPEQYVKSVQSLQ